ncbi:MAG: diguanylate cyclase [Nitrospirae bacterium]|nr:diguanylate cyclase [Nitrospirota bacterium]
MGVIRATPAAHSAESPVAAKPPSRTLLIVDDTAPVRETVRTVLGATRLFGQILEAETGLQALDLMQKTMVDMLISDVVMSPLDGYKLTATVKRQPRYKSLPVILLTSETDPNNKVKGLDLGANDYVTKPFDPGELVARVKNLLRIKELQQEVEEKNAQLAELNQRLEAMAITDELTGLFNRRHFMERLKEEYARSKRYQMDLSCIMFDIDNFKRINDQWGHQTGDKVLRELGALLKRTHRTHDLAARYGGEEFILILCQTDHRGAMLFAEQLRKHVQDHPFTTVDGQALPVTVSVGVGSHPAPDVTQPDDLVRVADGALYQAKRTGKNRVVTARE